MNLNRYHIALVVIVLGVFVWSGVAPKDRLTWVMEVADRGERASINQ